MKGTDEDARVNEAIIAVQKAMTNLAAALLVEGRAKGQTTTVLRLIGEAEHAVMRAVTAAGRHPGR